MSPARTSRLVVFFGLGLGLGLVGCTSKNPDFCDPERPDPLNCPAPQTQQDLPASADLRSGPGVDLVSPADLRMPEEIKDIHVDNKNGTCRGAHMGTQADPLCTLKEAVELSARSGRRVVHVAASRSLYDSLQIEGLTITFRGPGGFAEPPAMVPQVRVSGAASVVLDGFSFGQRGVTDVVRCQSEAGATPSLEVIYSLFHNGTGYGAAASRCKLMVRRGVLYENAQGGILADNGSELYVENAVIGGNSGPAVRALSASARVRFSTIAGNGRLNTTGAVECGTMGGSKQIQASIIVNNTFAVGGRPVSAACRMDWSAVSFDGPFPNGSNNKFNARPDFMAVNDLRLKRGAGSNACCIDQLDGMAAGVSDVTVDLEGTARPVNMRWDIGATEVK
jgi:hypothetical protein